MCVFVLRPSLFPSASRGDGGRARALSFECKTNQFDFTDWMSSFPYNLMVEISTNPEVLNAVTYILSSAWNSWKDKNHLGTNALI